LASYRDTLKSRFSSVIKALIEDAFGSRGKIPRAELVNKLVSDKNFSFLLDTAMIRKRLEEARVGEDLDMSTSNTQSRLGSNQNTDS
jgi:hypothetical protein